MTHTPAPRPINVEPCRMPFTRIHYYKRDARVLRSAEGACDTVSDTYR